MKTLRLHSIWIWICILTACGQKLAFSGGVSSQSVKSIDSCTPGQTNVTVPTKFLFIVDMSGSNFDGPYEHPGDATDPQKTFRYGVINNFFQQQEANSMVNWGFETFNGSSAASLISSQSLPAFSNAQAMNSALQTFLQTPDTGATPYKAALQMAHDMIQRDMATASKNTQYRIAFITDGYPTDYCPGGPTQVSCPGQIMNSAIDADVESLVELAPQAIQFSTVYYGLPDSDASARLQEMAQTGNGQFVDTNVSKNLSLNDVVQVPTNCPVQ